MAVALDKLDSLANKMGLKPAHEPPVKSFQHKQVPTCLILTNFWYDITSGHITIKTDETQCQ